MSGFRKFRSTQLRRRKAELLELGHLRPAEHFGRIAGTAPAAPVGGVALAPHEADNPVEFSLSAEAREIGPRPIAWLRMRKQGTDH